MKESKKTAGVRNLVPNQVRARKLLRGLGLLCAGVFIVLTAFFANFHVFTAPNSLPMVLQKAHLSLKDNIVSIDAIMSTPKSEAKRRWPVAYETLAQDGLLLDKPKLAYGAPMGAVRPRRSRAEGKSQGRTANHSPGY